MTAGRLVLAVALAAPFAGCTPDAPANPPLDVSVLADSLSVYSRRGASPRDASPLANSLLADPPLPVPATSGVLSAGALAGVFEGYYSNGFEHSGFRPCADTVEAWWAEPATTATPIAGNQSRVDWTSAANLYTHYQNTVGDRTGVFGEGVAVWARLRGRATPRGALGHLNAYARDFAVDSVEAMRLEAPAGACVRPSHIRPWPGAD